MVGEKVRTFAVRRWVLMLLVTGFAVSCGTDSAEDDTTTCPTGHAECGGECFDLTTNAQHCGSCATVCTPGQTCEGGVCQCQASLTDCSGQCVDLQGDGSNCGSCGTTCQSDQVCAQGTCSTSGCPQGQLQCGTDCMDPATDPLNCGGCNVPCTSPMVCSGGTCVCPAGGTDCSGQCVDTTSDLNNCGACGVQCTDAATCSNGVCVGGGSGGGPTGGTGGGGGNTGGQGTGGIGGVSTGGSAQVGGTGGASTGGSTQTGGTGGVSTGGSTQTGGTGGEVDGCATVSVEASGDYSVTFENPDWTFSGSLGAAASSVSSTTGSDALGSYCDTTFTYSASGDRSCRIRVYAATPVVVFSESSTASVQNTRNFPRLTSIPNLPHHITYGGGGGFSRDFIQYHLTEFIPDSPFVYFDNAANTFIISGASHFPNTQTEASGGGIVSGIQENIGTLPAGFEVSTILVADTSFNQAYENWGQALLAFTGKQPVANDATPVLEKLGYWTDNGATYYYNTEPGMDYETTLRSVVSYYGENGVPLAYMQLDSWWYPKGPSQSWSASDGFYRYEAHRDLFPNGLASFQQSLGIPLVTHNRWLDASSPYRNEYECSGNTVIDPAFWADRAECLRSSGVATYEQDWLSTNGLPDQNNLADQEAYLGNMAQAMEDAGLDIQYCMPLARHIMQSTKYANVTNSRVSSDRFDSGKYMEFFHGTRLAWSVRLWPWSDVFRTNERDNLLVSTLSAGLVGAADAIGGADFANIRRVIRPDAVIVKPDIPLLAFDRSIVDDANGSPGGRLTMTYTEHAGGRFAYVYVFNGAASFAPSELGYTSSVYVYDVHGDSGEVLDSSQQYSTSGSTRYYVVAPIGPSGIAFLGDEGKFVPLGRKRISAFSDDGTIGVSVEYASGEGAVTLQGYAPAAPTVTATSGTVGSVSYDSSSRRFTVPVTASGTSATISIAL